MPKTLIGRYIELCNLTQGTCERFGVYNGQRFLVGKDPRRASYVGIELNGYWADIKEGYYRVVEDKINVDEVDISELLSFL